MAKIRSQRRMKILLDMRVAEESIPNNPYRLVKLVGVWRPDAAMDCALLANDKHLVRFDPVVNEQQAILIGLGRIQDLYRSLPMSQYTSASLEEGVEGETPIESTKTVLDLRIPEGVKGVPGGAIKIVQGTHINKVVDYSVFVQDDQRDRKSA
jgi:hypothetical protein